MANKINVEGTTATVTTEVDLAEWGGKYPDDQGVLNAAVREIQKSVAAISVPASTIDAQIAALTKQKSDAVSLRPDVTIAGDVARVDGSVESKLT